MVPWMPNDDGAQRMVNVANRFPQTSWTLIDPVREGGDGARPAFEEFKGVTTGQRMRISQPSSAIGAKRKT